MSRIRFPLACAARVGLGFTQTSVQSTLWRNAWCKLAQQNDTEVLYGGEKEVRIAAQYGWVEMEEGDKKGCQDFVDVFHMVCRYTVESLVQDVLQKEIKNEGVDLTGYTLSRENIRDGFIRGQWMELPFILVEGSAPEEEVVGDMLTHLNHRLNLTSQWVERMAQVTVAHLKQYEGTGALAAVTMNLYEKDQIKIMSPLFLDQTQQAWLGYTQKLASDWEALDLKKALEAVSEKSNRVKSL